MGYEANTGLNVYNHYGPRDSGGTRGVFKTEGYQNEFVWNLESTGLPFKFPVPVGGVEVVKVDVFFAEGTVSAVTVGGVAVLAATEAAPVALAANNTGVLAQTGGTGGVIVIRYRNVAV